MSLPAVLGPPPITEVSLMSLPALTLVGLKVGLKVLVIFPPPFPEMPSIALINLFDDGFVIDANVSSILPDLFIYFARFLFILPDYFIF